MIETVENAAQLAVVGVCCGISFYRLTRRRSRLWVLMTLFYGSFLLGLLYWLLYLLFYGYTPEFRYISELSWYTSYLFLAMVLHLLADPAERSVRSWIPKLTIVFAAGMCVLYMHYSSWMSNILSAVVMSLMMYQAVRGLIFHKKQKPHGRHIWLYCAVLLFCSAEYLMWTITCFYWSDTMKNPYFWFDIQQTLCFPLFIPAVSVLEQPAKAVNAA